MLHHAHSGQGRENKKWVERTVEFIQFRPYPISASGILHHSKIIFSHMYPRPSSSPPSQPGSPTKLGGARRERGRRELNKFNN
jgi:hypothetical protein